MLAVTGRATSRYGATDLCALHLSRVIKITSFLFIFRDDPVDNPGN